MIDLQQLFCGGRKAAFKVAVQEAERQFDLQVKVNGSSVISPGQSLCQASIRSCRSCFLDARWMEENQLPGDSQEVTGGGGLRSWAGVPEPRSPSLLSSELLD